MSIWLGHALNRYAGHCSYCNQWIEAEQGLLIYGGHNGHKISHQACYAADLERARTEYEQHPDCHWKQEAANAG